MTTIEQPITKMARQAMELLLNCITSDGPQQPRTVAYDSKLTDCVADAWTCLVFIKYGGRLVVVQQSSLVWWSVFLFFFSLYITAPTIAAYAESLNFSALFIGVTVGLYGVAMVFVRIPLGIVASITGARKGLIQIGLISIILGLSLAFVPYRVVLLASRFLLGVGASVYVLYTVIYFGYFPRNKLPEAASRITAAYAAPQILAALVGGYASEQWGWLAPFAIGAIASLLALVLISALKGEATRRGHSWVGWSDLAGAINIRLSIVSLIAMIGFFVALATMYGFTQNWAVNELGANKQELGWILFSMVVPYTLALIAAGWVQGLIGVPWTIGFGMGLLGLGVILTPISSSVTVLLLWQAVGGAGLGLAFPTTMAESIRNVNQDVKYWVMSVYQSTYALGLALGPIAAGIIAGSLGLAVVFKVMGGVAFTAILLVALLQVGPAIPDMGK